MTKENRKRSVQVKFRLTPEENVIFENDVKKSGLSKNEYIIKAIINRIGISAINCERRYCAKSVDISFKIGGQRIGYASCLFFENLKKVQISSLYVVKAFQNVGIEERLLQEIYEYAEMKEAVSVIAYPSIEPYCPTEWKPLEEQKAWYEKHGFYMDHLVYGSTPCMIKDLIGGKTR